MRNPHSLALGLVLCTAMVAGHVRAEGTPSLPQNPSVPLPQNVTTLPQNTTMLPGIPGSPSTLPGTSGGSAVPSLGPADNRAAIDLQQLNLGAVQELQSLQSAGDVDQDFAQLLRRRLEQDMKLAELEARRGRSRVLREQALRLYQSRREELARLQQWLGDHQSR